MFPRMDGTKFVSMMMADRVRTLRFGGRMNNALSSSMTLRRVSSSVGEYVLLESGYELLIRGQDTLNLLVILEQ